MRPECTQAQATRAELLCRVHSIRTVSKITGLAPNTISRMRDRGWKPADRVKSCQRPRPTDFAIMNARMTIKPLMKHYRAGCRAIARWRRELEGRG